MFCPNCGIELAEGAAFCKECGTRVPPSADSTVKSGPRCPVCGRELPADAAFCKACGTRVDAAVSTAANAGTQGAQQQTPIMQMPQGQTPRAQWQTPIGYTPQDQASGVQWQPNVGQQQTPADNTPQWQTPNQQWQTPVANIPQGQTPGAQWQTPVANAPQGQTPGSQWQTPASAAQFAQTPPAASQSAGGARRPSRTRYVLIAAVAAVALLAGGIGGFMLWTNQRQVHDESVAASAAYDAAHARHAVVFKVDAAGYSDDTATKIPVHVTGSDQDGVTVDEDAFVDAEGAGLELSRGVYVVSVITSPLTSDGTIYNVPTTTWNVAIGDDTEPGSTVDATAQPVVLTPVADYTTVSDETLAKIYDYAGKSGQDQGTVDTYKSTTDSRVQTAKDEKIAADTAAAKTGSNHWDMYYASCELPDAWLGKCSNGSCVGHTSGYWHAECRFGNSSSITVLYFDGDYKEGSCEGVIFNFAPHIWNAAHGQAPDSYLEGLSTSQMDEVLKLSTGNVLTYDKVAAMASEDEAKAAGEKATTEYYDKVIKPSVSLNQQAAAYAISSKRGY